MPNPFLFAVILTFIAYLMGILIAGQGPIQMIDHWYGGFWNLHVFAMQMVFILVTGYVLAYHHLTQKLIRGLARLPGTGKQAVVMVALVAMILSWINWGLGLIVGAIMARETARQAHFKNIKIHYPVLCTTGYMGLGLTWHWGLSGSAPLLSATEGHIFADLIGVIPTSETIFSGYGLALSLVSLAYACIVLFLLTPKSPERIKGIDHYVPEAVQTSETAADRKTDAGSVTVANKIDNSRIIGGILAIISLSGLGVIMAGWLVSISTSFTFPAIAWLTAGLVNLFVPSGGGEWSVAGETVLRAALELNVPVGKAIIAYSVGDAWTNLFQPFWAIPLLGITGIQARDMFGYCITMLFALFPFLAIVLTLIPY